MKIFLTGHSGFIGYHVTKALLDRGDHVTGFDNHNNYYPQNLKFRRVDSLQNCDKGSLENATTVSNLTDKKLLHKCLPEDCDVIVNLAAQAGVRYSLKNPQAYIDSNLTGFINLLECAKEKGIKKVVYASSSSVYGNANKAPFQEDERCDQPLSLYAATKRANELIAHSYGHLFDFQTIGLRFFSVYGPWGRPDMMLWIFTEKILAEKPIQLFNNGDMVRDFTYIDDIVSGVVSAVDKCGTLRNKSEIINLGNHKPCFLMEVVNLLGQELGKEPIIEKLPMQPGDVAMTCASHEKAALLLGWQPTTSIKDGIKQWCDWYRNFDERYKEEIRKWRQSDSL